MVRILSPPTVENAADDRAADRSDNKDRSVGFRHKRIGNAQEKSKNHSD
jgi:hypothetical protein